MKREPGAPFADAAVAAVELRDVSKRFGTAVALHGIDLSIRKGEFFSLLGPSGCGKTTTLNLIGGFESASTGSVLIEGQPVQDVPSFKRPVNTVFQNYALFPHMTVAENVEFGLRMKQVPLAQRRQAAAEMLRLVSLQGFEDRRPAQLSGGQRQRVALARALVNRPSVLLLDEPLGALDLKLRKQMQAELTRIQRQVGITFIYVTHDQEEALAMSDRIAVMDHGRLLQVGTPAEIYGAPACREVMEFIGSVNVFDGRVANVPGQVDLQGVGRMPALGAADLAPGSEVAVLVRPERVRLSTQSAGAPLSAGQGTLVKLAQLGFVTHCTVQMAQGSEVLSYRLNSTDEAGGDLPAEHQPVQLWWDAADAQVYPARAQAHPAGPDTGPTHP
jgi:spermidine/putrescine transport system ATP-binding protein